MGQNTKRPGWKQGPGCAGNADASLRLDGQEVAERGADLAAKAGQAAVFVAHHGRVC